MAASRASAEKVPSWESDLGNEKSDSKRKLERRSVLEAEIDKSVEPLSFG